MSLKCLWHVEMEMPNRKLDIGIRLVILQTWEPPE